MPGEPNKRSPPEADHPQTLGQFEPRNETHKICVCYFSGSPRKNIDETYCSVSVKIHVTV